MSIDTNVDHSVCMRLLQDAGIYVLFTLNSPSASSYRSDGVHRVSWDCSYYERFSKIIDTFHNYSNTLGFVLGMGCNQSYMIQVKKAVVIYMEEYIKSKEYRNIPIGLTNRGYGIDVPLLAQFLNCGDRNRSIDSYGWSFSLEDHSWCVNSSSLLQDGFADQYANYSIPVFLFYGCEARQQHDFAEVQEIYGNITTKVFSGGIVQEWLEDWGSGADLGLVDIRSNNVTPRLGYMALSSQLALIQPSSTIIKQYVPRNTAPSTCHKFTIRDTWDPDARVARDMEIATELPTKPYARLCSCMIEALNCIANPGTSLDSIREATTSVCHRNNLLCKGFMRVPDSGQYGSFMECKETERASWAFNQFYVSMGNDPAACSSVGGRIQTPTPSASQASDCQILLLQAGPEGTGTGTGTVTLTPIPSHTLQHNDQKGGDTSRTSLTTATKAGISIGITIAVLLFASLAVYFRFRRKKKARSLETDRFGRAELPASLAGQDKERVERKELDGSERNELDGNEIAEVNRENSPSHNAAVMEKMHCR